MRALRTFVRAGAVLAGLALFAGPSLAETVKYKAELKGEAESPPNESGAKGHAEMTFDTGTKVLSWTVEYSGLSGPAIGAHIHGPAQPGTNAGIMIPFPKAESPITGSGKLNPDQEKALNDATLYVNVHTKQHPGGELRGQLMKE